MASHTDARPVAAHAPRRLPPQLTSFVGRGPELAAVADALACTRLVTLTGAGGCGKSRLAAEVADRLASAYPDGLWWVDLAALTDPALLPASVAAALEVRETAGADAVATIQERLGDRELLVVLDNCEHLVDGCAAMTERLLQACDGLRILATSREPLDVSGEAVWRVPSLAEDDAVRLFVERAQQSDAGFRLTAQATADVAELCRRLDGMPLAIELAAARVRTLSPRQIVDALDDRFRLLGRAGRGGLPRHATLRASVDWSYELLDADEQRLLARMAVFPASFSLDAVQAVCGDAGDVLVVLDRLVDRSLVQPQDAGGENRYRLLETIREYAAGKLDPAEAAALRDAHLQVSSPWPSGLSPSWRVPSRWPGFNGWTVSCPTCGAQPTGRLLAARARRSCAWVRRSGCSSLGAATSPRWRCGWRARRRPT